MSLLNSRKDIGALVRESLVLFPPYKSTHFVQAHGSSECLDIEYQSLPFVTSNKLQGIEFHFGKRGDAGFLGWVFIPEDLRRKGYCTALMKIGEGVLKGLGCYKVELTPSGKGKLEFYGKRGYTKTNSPFDVMVKKL